MKKIKKILIFVFCIAVLLSSFAFADETRGIVRVKLTNYKLEKNMKLGIWGSYALNSDLFFQSGTELNISIENDEFVIKYKGISIKAGKELFFRRYLSGLKENGLRINGALHLIEGDLKLTINEGKILPVLYIVLEDYLKGVVPFEMNNSFPIEALKAQAIAARTYAVMSLKPKKDFDLVDNTNDQVYKGMLSENELAHKAVIETNARILTYNSKPAHCYYTASNGGITEKVSNVWQGKDLAYLVSKEDKFDKANPESIVKTATIYKDFNKLNEKYPAFAQVVYEKTAAKLKKSGYDETAFTIDKISDLSFSSEKTIHSLGFNKQLIVTLNATARKAGENAAKSVKLKLEFSIFDEIEAPLDISINVKKNELSALEDKGDFYALSFRRYGHGVGLSQRGAQQMAKEGYNYKQILGFYFPSTKLMLYKSESNLSEMPYSSFEASPAPKPTATPKPTHMPLNKYGIDKLKIAVVDKINKLETLNLRTKPSSNADIIMQMYYGQELMLVENIDDTWIRVKTDVAEGYVMRKFVSFGMETNKQK